MPPIRRRVHLSFAVRTLDHVGEPIALWLKLRRLMSYTAENLQETE